MSTLASWWFNSEIDDLPDNWINMGGVFTKVAPTATIERKFLVHTAEISEGDIQSLHTDDDSTAYQNTSGNAAFANIELTAANASGANRHIKIFSSPTIDSITGATELIEIGQSTAGLLENNGDTMVVKDLRIEPNHYLTIQHIDDSRTGDIRVRVVHSELSFVEEYSGI
jgi:hypothetical protein